MAEENIQWLHSHGLSNKNPDYDLGGIASKFELAVLPKNNLFKDVKFSDAIAGFTDYRCFYIQNTFTDTTFLNVQVSLSLAPSCGIINFGSKFQNEKQVIEIYGTPQANGFIILEMPFGGSLITCIYTSNNTVFAAEIQNKIQSTPLCSTSTVTVLASSADYVKFLVEFTGEAKHRKIDLIKLVQNNLTNLQGPEYRVADFAISDAFNGIGDTQIKVTRNIDVSAGTIGKAYIINTTTGQYESVVYNSYLGNILNLDSPLPCTLNRGDEVWINLYPYGSPWSNGYSDGFGGAYQRSIVKCNIVKYQEGYPINQYSEITENVLTAPSSVVFDTTSLDIGTLKPKDGFFIWVKRIIAPNSTGCNDQFSFTFSGD